MRAREDMRCGAMHHHPSPHAPQACEPQPEQNGEICYSCVGRVDQRGDQPYLVPPGSLQDQQGADDDPRHPQEHGPGLAFIVREVPLQALAQPTHKGGLSGRRGRTAALSVAWIFFFLYIGLIP